MDAGLRILALEPYYGGSHKAFVQGWSEQSAHTWTVLGLPPYKWKWRMRHAAITLSRSIEERSSKQEEWDCVFCSDMLDLATFKALAPRAVQHLPTLIYFHENQLTYPLAPHDRRDYHFGLINMTSALAADAVWFNSAYHRESFLSALHGLLCKMPDHQPWTAIPQIEAKASIKPQGVRPIPGRSGPPDPPLRILWAGRWEYDKAPETFFTALAMLQEQHVEFRVSVIGEQFRNTPPVFAEARKRFGYQIDAWGYQESEEAYQRALLGAHVVVSTAIHEFFGISMVEGVLAGAFPLMPNRLSYPEIFDVLKNPMFFYDGTAEHLATRLRELAAKLEARPDWTQQIANQAIEPVSRFRWEILAPQLDSAVERVART